MRSKININHSNKAYYQERDKMELLHHQNALAGFLDHSVLLVLKEVSNLVLELECANLALTSQYLLTMIRSLKAILIAPTNVIQTMSPLMLIRCVKVL